MDVAGKDYALDAVAKSLNKFAGQFYKILSKEQTGNFVCSPVGVSTLLSMILFGAHGNTEKELRAGLHVTENDAVIKRGLKILYEQLRSDGEFFQLCLANKVFIDKNYALVPEFQAITETIFKSKCQSLGLSVDNAPKACEIINKWCSETTNGLIKSIIEPESFTEEELIVMFLANAVYFKAQWCDRFGTRCTKIKDFYINESTVKKVSMMHHQTMYNSNRLSHLNAEYIELPYKTGNRGDGINISMFIILPDEMEKLSKIESCVEEIDFKELHDNRQTHNTNLELPKFSIEVEFELTSILEKMGMNEMFRDGVADFRGICTRDDASVSKIVQKVFINVTEEGTEAAAFTYMRLRGGGEYVEPKDFIVNRPFICSIVATDTGIQLFSARVVDPIVKSFTG